MRKTFIIVFTLLTLVMAGTAIGQDSSAVSSAGVDIQGADVSANITGASSEAFSTSGANATGGNSASQSAGGSASANPTQNNSQATTVGGQSTTIGDQLTTVGGQSTTVGGQSTEVGGQTTEVAVDPTQSVNYNAPLFQDNSVHEAVDLSAGRAFAIPGEVIFPGTPGYFGEATPGHRFIPLNKLLRFTTVWDANKAANMLKGGFFGNSTGAKDVQIRDLYADQNTEPTDLVYCSIANPADLGANMVDQVSIGTVAATNRKSISADVLATAIVKASERGANFILFMAEGVNREVDAQGWGIGFNTTQASLHGGGNGSSNVTSGGFGYSRGWSGYIDYPWLQFTFLSVDGIDGLPVATAIQTKELLAQTGNHTAAGSIQ